MNILFICMSWPEDNSQNMYSDLMDEFVVEKHSVSVATLCEKRRNIETSYSNERGMEVLRVKCGNIQKTNKYNKVISSFLGGYQLKWNIYKYYKNKKFDLVVFALPPLTITLPLVQIKKYYGAKLYLLLKEFWPQDPIDLGAMSANGIVSKVFSYLEHKLYKNSEFIGTMSKAGIEYIRKKKVVSKCVVEECPNSQKDIVQNVYSFENRYSIRAEYNIGNEEVVFIFGGNLGVSQGIPEMISAIKACENIKKAKFLIVGDGTEANKLRSELSNQENVLFIDRKSQREYEKLVYASDVGLIFLYPQYTVPNVPSRLVTYLMFDLPVIACVDHATDVGRIIQENGCGYSVYNGDSKGFEKCVVDMIDDHIRESFKEKSRNLFLHDYTSKRGYEIISKHFH